MKSVSADLIISPATARRFVLGRQGLWPGRRWQGLAGVIEAITTMEGLQLDPLTVVARSQDIALWGRVHGYHPDLLHQATYEQRRFFDYGGWLFLYPMTELPYWRVPMALAAREGHWAEWLQMHAAVADEVRTALRTHGPLGNRDFNGNTRVSSYRGRKDTALALFALWITGEVMITRRAGFDRVYDLSERVAPPHLNTIADEAAATRYFVRKAIALYGLLREGTLRSSLYPYLRRTISIQDAKALVQDLQQQGTALAVRVEGQRDRLLLLAEDAPLLAALAAGETPAAWQPLNSTTFDEAVFLAPLDMVSARGRAARLFDFDYKWEVYVPAAKRRWGYYVLPILYGDRLVARLDPKLERRSKVLHIQGFWLEDHAPADDPGFALALRRGLDSFAAFAGADAVEIHAPLLQDLLGR